jgi:hypothetical protein
MVIKYTNIGHFKTLENLPKLVICWFENVLSGNRVSGRVSMVMMSLLTLMAMFGGVRQNTPKVMSPFL